MIAAPRLRVLVACEYSGRVRDAFAARGHDAWSCDLLASETPGNHIQDDVLAHLADGWDLMIAHPPCTYLSRAGANLWKQRERQAVDACVFARTLYDAPISKVAIENPIGRLSVLWRPPDQRIHPWAFGDPYTKPTDLWLRNLSPLFAGPIVQPYPSTRRVKPNPNRSGTTYGRFMRENRSPRARSRTFPGIAAAMAEQWG